MAIVAVKTENRVALREEFLQRARAMVPALSRRATECEELRRLHPDSEKELHESGLFRILQPERVGGSELDYGMLVDVGAELARGCASTAWNVTNLASHHWMLGMFPKKAQDDVWGESTDHLVASSLVFPAGRAKPVDGGYTLSGRWPFSSGVDNCAWNMLAGVVGGETEDNPPEYRLFLVPSSDYRVVDNWYATGLRGTGSKDVEGQAMFVPSHRTVAVNDLKGGATPGSDVNPAPLYRVPVFSLFSFVLSGVALGNAQGAWDTYVEDMRHRTSIVTSAQVGDFQTMQVKIAKSGALIDSARLLMQHNCQEAMGMAASGSVPDMKTKVRFRRDGAFSVDQCTQSVDIMFSAAGGGGIYDRNPVQRRFRDAHAINAHIAYNFDMVGTAYGRVVLGHSPDNPTL